MLLASLIFSSRDWLWPAVAALVLGASVVLWAYRTGPTSPVRWLCTGLKVLGIATLALCLLDPQWSGQRAVPGANLFAVVADNSQGLQIKDNGEARTRAENLAHLVASQQSDWQVLSGFGTVRFL